MIGYVAALVGCLLAAKTARAAAAPEKCDSKEFANPAWQTLMYLFSAALPLHYPVDDEPVKWALLVVMVGVGIGYFSVKGFARED